MKLPKQTSAYSLTTPGCYSLSPFNTLAANAVQAPHIVPQVDPTFREGWDDARNNDAGNGGAGGLNQTKITQCLRNYSKDLDAAIDCGLIEVIKGCHQLGDPHITINGKVANSKMTKKCQSNIYAGTSSVHIPCGTC